jgi:hypothetical protein
MVCLCPVVTTRALVKGARQGGWGRELQYCRWQVHANYSTVLRSTRSPYPFLITGYWLPPTPPFMWSADRNWASVIDEKPFCFLHKPCCCSMFPDLVLLHLDQQPCLVLVCGHLYRQFRTTQIGRDFFSFGMEPNRATIAEVIQCG